MTRSASLRLIPGPWPPPGNGATPSPLVQPSSNARLSAAAGLILIPQPRPLCLNPHRARRPAGAPLTAISCLGASRTPPVGVCGSGRHAGVRETCTDRVVALIECLDNLLCQLADRVLIPDMTQGRTLHVGKQKFLYGPNSFAVPHLPAPRSTRPPHRAKFLNRALQAHFGTTEAHRLSSAAN